MSGGIGASRRTTLAIVVLVSLIGTLFPDRNFLLDSVRAAVPAAPTGLTTRAGNGYIRVSFTAPAGTITNYKYQLSTDGGATYADPVAFSPADTASPVQIGGLTNGSPYTIKLLAVNADGTGTASSEVTATPTPLTAYVGSGSSRNAFLQGQYAEVGVRRNGAFGSNQVPPTGFHHNVGNCLGFRVDRSFDGWDQTSTDDGDFFCPGSPYEGWSIKVTDSGTAFNECDTNQGSGFLGTFDNLTTADGAQSVRWTSDTNYTSSSRGTSGSAGVQVVQVSSVPDNSQVLHVDITLTNTTASSLSNIYYARSFDPDNYTASGVYTSTNTVIGQGTSSEVKSTWTNGSLIMMKSTDSRSRAARRDSGFGCSEDPKYIYEAHRTRRPTAGLRPRRRTPTTLEPVLPSRSRVLAQGSPRHFASATSSRTMNRTFQVYRRSTRSRVATANFPLLSLVRLTAQRATTTPSMAVRLGRIRPTP